mgnify:CR=1 FL=1
MVLFILFPGNNASKHIWYKDINRRVNFLQKLREIGEVYIFTPNIYNVIYYYQNKKTSDKELLSNIKMATKPVSLSLDDIDIDKQCKIIYEKVKSYKGKFIPIGHSVGGWFAIHFTKLYSSRCLKTIIIENPTTNLGWTTTKYETTNKELEILFEKIKNNKDNIKYLKKIIKIKNYYYYKNGINKFNGILSKPTLFFDTFHIPDKSKWNQNILEYQEKLYKKNGEKVSFINFTNTNHFPWFISKYNNEMINQIKCFVE